MFQVDGVVTGSQALESVVLSPALALPAVSLNCFVHDSKAWINKWQKVHLSIGGGCAAWASSAVDASAALASGSSKKATRVSISACAAESMADKLDSKQYAVRVKLSDGVEVRRLLVVPCVALFSEIVARLAAGICFRGHFGTEQSARFVRERGLSNSACHSR